LVFDLSLLEGIDRFEEYEKTSAYSQAKAVCQTYRSYERREVTHCSWSYFGKRIRARMAVTMRIGSGVSVRVARVAIRF
jgi:hypothetical protein